MSSPKSSGSEPNISLSAADSSRALYQKGLDSLASGDATIAAELFRQALAADPANTRASEELRRITPGGAGTNGVSPESGTTQTADPDSAFDRPVANLASLLPTSISGYELGPRTVDAVSAAETADPIDRDLAHQVRRALLTVYDRGSADEAANFIATASRRAYDHDSATISVKGVEGYFGTDGATFASISYARGRFVFEVILTAQSGVAPSSIKEHALAVAATFPTSP